MADCKIEGCPRVYGRLSDAAAIPELDVDQVKAARLLIDTQLCQFHFEGIHTLRMRYYQDAQAREYVDETNNPDGRERTDFRYKPLRGRSEWLGTIVFNIAKTGNIEALDLPTYTEFVAAIELEKLGNEFIDASNAADWVMNKAPCVRNLRVTLHHDGTISTARASGWAA